MKKGEREIEEETDDDRNVDTFLEKKCSTMCLFLNFMIVLFMNNWCSTKSTKKQNKRK